MGFGGLSKTRTVFFCGGLTGYGEKLSVLQVTSGGAVAFLADCTELNTIEDQFSLIAIDLGTVKKVFLLRLILRGGGWSFQKKRYQLYSADNGSGGPGFTGLSVLQGKVI